RMVMPWPGAGSRTPEGWHPVGGEGTMAASREPILVGRLNYVDRIDRRLIVASLVFTADASADLSGVAEGQVVRVRYRETAGRQRRALEVRRLGAGSVVANRVRAAMDAKAWREFREAIRDHHAVLVAAVQVACREAAIARQRAALAKQRARVARS